MTEPINRISLEDNSDQAPPKNPNINYDMSEGEQKKEEKTEEQPQESSTTGENPLGLSADAPEQKKLYEKPEAMGNAMGDKIEGFTAPVGNTLNKGLGVVAKPVGSILEPVVGGIMKSGEGFGDMVGVGFGNKEGGPGKQGEAEQARLKRGEGGNLETGDNPLGL